MGFDRDSTGKPVIDPGKETTQVNLVMGIVVMLFIIIGTLLAWWYFRAEPPPETAAASAFEHAGLEIR